MVVPDDRIAVASVARLRGVVVVVAAMRAHKVNDRPRSTSPVDGADVAFDSI